MYSIAFWEDLCWGSPGRCRQEEWSCSQQSCVTLLCLLVLIPAHVTRPANILGSYSPLKNYFLGAWLKLGSHFWDKRSAGGLCRLSWSQNFLSSDFFSLTHMSLQSFPPSVPKALTPDESNLEFCELLHRLLPWGLGVNADDGLANSFHLVWDRETCVTEKLPSWT